MKRKKYIIELNTVGEARFSVISGFMVSCGVVGAAGSRGVKKESVRLGKFFWFVMVGFVWVGMGGKLWDFGEGILLNEFWLLYESVGIHSPPGEQR